MNDPLRALMAAGIGAALMYYFDPARGRYRRALVANQLARLDRESRRSVDAARRDLYNRGAGTLAAVRSALSTAPASDDVLEARVRSCLGRVVSHSASVHVAASAGVVTLSGPILESEVASLIACVRRVPGVADVRNELDAHAEAGNVPGLQGGSRVRSTERGPFRATSWTPAERLAGALGGMLAMVCSVRQRGAVGGVLGAAGVLLLGRATANVELRRLLGIGLPRHAIHVQKSIRIDAPIEQVFALWDDFENFPSFMSHVLRVRRLATDDGEQRWRWTVEGPSGSHVVFESIVTAREENRLIAWRTVAGAAAVHHGGVVKFTANDDGTTTVDVRMVYSPTGGMLGHGVAWLLGADPKRRMDDDLLRMKTYLETGRPPRDAAAAPGAAGTVASSSFGPNGHEGSAPAAEPRPPPL